MPAKKGTTKNTSSRKTGKKPAKSSASGSSAKTAAQQPHRREIGAVVCLLLAIFSFIGYFSSDGWFIDFFRSFLSGLVGRGFYLFPPALLLGAYILFFHRGRPVRLRLACALLIPLMLGAVLHLFGCKTEYEWSWNVISTLYRDGSAAGVSCCGGVFGGLLAMGFGAMFGKVGAGIVFVIALLFLLLMAFNATISGIVDWYRSREKVEYEYIPKPEKTKKEKPEVAEEATPEPGHTTEIAGKTRHTSRVIDFPVDDPINPPKEDKDSFFDSNPAVPTPDKVLSGEAEPVPEKKQPVNPEPLHREEEAQKAANAAVPEVSEHVPAQSVNEIMKPLEEELAASKKMEKLRNEAEKRAASIEVAEAIEESLGNSEPAAYVYPPTSLLAQASAGSSADGKTEVEMNARRLETTIQSFGINARLVDYTRGPSVTRYEVELEQGVKLSRLTNLADDLALALGATGVRVAPIPDKISIVGIEVPNKIVNVVALRELIESKEFTGKSSKLSFAVGKDIAGNPVVGDISKLPHLLIAGTTGSGKSVCMNSLILSLLFKSSPDEVRLIMIDPKMIELGVYNEIPHLLIPVVTDPKKAAGALQWAVVEMMKRYKLFSEVGARDLATYNTAIVKKEGGQTLPQIVVLIDELADLMLVAAKDVEESICRVAQMGRASGIHLVIATQRPSADVITGLMKGNIPSRIAFAVDSALNSRIILDTTGAEKLIGKGDMLYSPIGAGKPLRVQGAFVTDEEREAVVNFVKERSTAQYSENILEEIERNAEKDSRKDKDEPAEISEGDGEVDELFNSAVEVILEVKQASVSMLQRKLKLGYSRAARLVDQMEERGIVGPFEGSKPRQLLITREQWLAMQGIETQETLPMPEDNYVPEPEEDISDEPTE
ncbi:MAG: DNA translocase FtsK [Clostridiales bacterium]|nr:DNA translocase FtsK [Clostridiales bacterium]